MLYVWNRVENATSNYHSEGGIIVIAKDLARAREMIAEATADVEGPCEALTIAPDFQRDCGGDEYIAIHPDAGCC